MTDFSKTDKIVTLLLEERVRVLTNDEQSELNEWIKEDSGNQILYDSLKDESNIQPKLKILYSYDKEKAYADFAGRIKRKNLKIKQFLRYAALFIPFIFAIYFIYKYTIRIGPENEMLSDIRPGTSKATLELTDGSIIHLETEEKLIKEYDGISVQNKEKQLIYEPTDKKQNTGKVQYNTIKIPRGGEYQLSLSDGTQIWLNAETTLRYPVTFSDKTREVFLEGEAFFEIAKNSDWPFIVNTSDIKVNVLGTSFNIRAYKDEDVTSATLVSGKVSLIQAGNKQEFYLTPSDQAIVSKQETRIHKVNVDQFIAWKNGRILFEGNTLEEIFADLSRWYNIETGFADEDVKHLRFNIDVIRYSEFNKILEIVELTKKVKFEIKGNKVIILKNS